MEVDDMFGNVILLCGLGKCLVFMKVVKVLVVCKVDVCWYCWVLVLFGVWDSFYFVGFKL